jgi:uncharacterized protein YkwD
VVFQAWMNSPGHRAHILDRGLSEIGVGIAVSGGQYYFCQLFGAPG